MKKLILLLTVVFTMSSFTTSKKENSTIFFQQCWQDAWDFGTGWDNGDPCSEWYWTNKYVDELCDDEGNYL